MSNNLNDDTVKLMDLKEIDNMLIDMDGVLLDTAYDNYFWQKHIPEIYARKNSYDTEQSIKITHALFNMKKRTKDWYDLNYWSNMLDIDVEKEKLSEEMIDKIKLKQDIIPTLEYLKNECKLYLVTNAHRKTLDIKLKKFPLQEYFVEIICSHELGFIKEDIQFWFLLRNKINVDFERSILIEDTLDNIKAASHANLKSIYITDDESINDGITKMKCLSLLPSRLKET